MTEGRRWRWVTRDKGTHYEDIVSIWPGARPPTSRKWTGYEWPGELRPPGTLDYHQGPQHSIDIDANEFRKLFKFYLEKGDRLKIEFRGVREGKSKELSE